jgi:hypothetical protein
VNGSLTLTVAVDLGISGVEAHAVAVVSAFAFVATETT